jgi:serine protease
MVRSRLFFFTLGIALFLAGGTRGRGQTPASGGVIEFFAPPAIDLGLVANVSRSPDAAASKVRASIRVAGSSLDRVSPSGAHYVAGKVIVKFREGTSATAHASALSVTSAKASTQPSYANFEVMSIDPGADAEEAARVLAARPDVEYAQAAYRVHTDMVPNDPLYPKQWNLPDIDMERAWDIQPAAGSSITVAVVDTGIAYLNVTKSYHANAFSVDAAGNAHFGGNFGTPYPSLGDLSLAFAAAPELGPSSRFVKPHDFIWDMDPNLPVDLDGHGTHVSGTIGQLTNNNNGTAGVAFNVKLMPVKVIGSDWDDIFGAPHQGTDDVVARGIRYAADNGANIINMSIGRTGPSTCASNRNQDGCAPVVEDAIKYAVGKGVFVAIAAGNGFEDGNPTEVIAEIASRVPGAVSVAATDRAHSRAYYSSTGTWVKVAAPGGSSRGFGKEGAILQQTLDQFSVEAFITPDGFLVPPSRFTAPRFDAFGYWYYEGTSQATPHVSGVAAMLMQQGITSPAAIEAALEKFATPRGGTTGRNDEFGFGEINARNTLRGLGLAK